MRSIRLLDANVLIALVVREHEHHQRVSRWAESAKGYAVCPIVEGALVRYLVRVGESAATVHAIIEALHSLPKMVFFSDDLSFRDIDLSTVRGHRQVTDTYLASFAVHHGVQLVTLDEGLAHAHPRVAELIGAHGS